MVVLATKVYVEGEARERALRSLGAQVENALGDLDVTHEVGLRRDDFPAITIEGDDAVVARNLLTEEWGAITTDFEDGVEYVGTLERWDEEGITLDAGREIEVPTSELGLGPGDPTQIRNRFGLVQHLPMRFVYGDPPAPTGPLEQAIALAVDQLWRVAVNEPHREVLDQPEPVSDLCWIAGSEAEFARRNLDFAAGIERDSLTIPAF